MRAAIAEVAALKSRSIGRSAGGGLEPQDLLRLCGDNPAAGCRTARFRDVAGDVLSCIEGPLASRTSQRGEIVPELCGLAQNALYFQGDLGRGEN